MERDAQLAWLDGVDDDFGVGRHDQLRPLPGSHRPQFVIDGVLQDHVQVRVGFIEKQHGTLASVEERQQHENLLKPTACARDVQNRPIVRYPIVGANERAARVGRQQLVAEQLPDGSLERGPRGFIVRSGHKQVAKHLTGATETEELLYRHRLKQPLVCVQTGHWRHVYRLKFETSQRIRSYVRRGPDVDLFSAVGDEFHGDRPTRIVPNLDLDRVPFLIPAVRPEEVEAPKWDRRECLSCKRGAHVALSCAEIVEFAPSLKSERP